MTSARTTNPRVIGTAPGRTTFRAGTMWALAAAGANAAIWAGGRAADVSFSVTPAMSDSPIHVGVVEVVLATALAFAAGWALLLWAARRSDRAVRGVIITAAALALLSSGGPASTANDTATNLLLIVMHLATGAVFLVAASRVSR
jgi:heme A synthase